VYACYAPDSTAASMIKESKLGLTLSCYPDWGRFAEVVPYATCVVVALPMLAGPEFMRLKYAKSALLFPPVVLLTTFTKSNARALADLQVEEVIWLDELPTHKGSEFKQSIARACMCAWNVKAAHRIERCDHLALPLRKLISTALLASHPFRNVTEAAKAFKRDRRTLWSWCRGTPVAATNGGLKDFLDWLILLKCAVLRVSSRNWKMVADEAGFHVDTLKSLAERHGIPSLEALGAVEGQRILAAKLDAFITRLEVEGRAGT
jgi:hypothetical protein